MSDKGSINLALSKRQPLLKDKTAAGDDQSLLPKATKTHPKGSKGDENANVYFIGTATTIIEWHTKLCRSYLNTGFTDFFLNH